MRVASIPCLFDSFTNTFLYICLSHSCWAACACYFSDGLRNHWKHPYFLLGVCVSEFASAGAFFFCSMHYAIELIVSRIPIHLSYYLGLILKVLHIFED
jgi:hypothetical protein